MRTARDYRKADAKEKDMDLVHLIIPFIFAAFVSLVVAWTADFMK